MEVLMIGGTGTISYDATQYFLKKGHKVYLLNRGNRNDLKHQNLKYIIGDANNYEQLKESLRGYNFDVILDFIIFDVPQMEKRLQVYEGKCKQFFFISSATAYKLVDEIITEDTALGNPNWKYAREKAECENYLNIHSGEYSFSYTIIRPYITYDARRIPFPVITKVSYYSLLYRIHNNMPLIICGDGNNKLTLTHTEDFAVALEGLLLNPAAKNQAFHITGECITTWNEILAVVCKTLNKKAEVVYISTDYLAALFPSEHDELIYDKSCNHVYDNSKICKAVPEFKTTYSIEEGIKKAVGNLLANKSLQRVDAVWNYTIDVIIESYERDQGNLVHKATPWAKMMYFVYHKTNWKYVKKVFNRIRRLKGQL